MNHKSIDKRRGIHFLPHLFTSASLFSGFFAIITGFNRNFVLAAICICLSAVMDTIDGRVARLTNTQSPFGAEYDALADIVSFGVAPALIIYFWAFKNLHQLGSVVAFIYLASVALRLARFNTHLEDNSSLNRLYFNGLPSPASAVTIAALVWLFNNIGYANSSKWVSLLTTIITLYLSTMMMSSIHFKSLNNYNLKGKIIKKLVLIIFSITIMLIEPSVALFSIFMFYALSGIFSVIYSKYSK